MMGARAWFPLVVTALAGHAYGQPSNTPVTTGSPPAPPPTYAPPPPQPKQDLLCFAGRPHECASVLLLELGVRGGSGGAAVSYADVGLLLHDDLNAYGATIGVLGIEPDAAASAHVWYAARYRRYLGTWGMAADVSVGYAGGPALEVALGWSDVLAVTAGVNRYELENGDQDVVATAGIRAGSVLVGGALYVTVLVFGSAR
jgi:hypothetical protein